MTELLSNSSADRDKMFFIGEVLVDYSQALSSSEFNENKKNQNSGPYKVGIYNVKKMSGTESLKVT